MERGDFDWTLVRSFLAVLDSGSVLGASRRTGSTQATLSRHIQELERQLGVVLFERTGRGVVATGAASQIIAAARRMEAEARNLGLAVTAARELDQGTVRVSCSQVMAAYLMPALLVELQQLHPGLQLELVGTNRVSNLLRREADMAVRLVKPDQGTLVARRVARLQLGFYADSAYLQRQGMPVDLEGLLHHRLIGLDADDTLIRAFRRVGLSVTREAFAVRSDDQVAGIGLTVAGAGIGVVPHFVAVQFPGLRPVLPDLAPGSLPVWIAVHREIRSSRPVRIVFDFLAARIPAQLGLRGT